MRSAFVESFRRVFVCLVRLLTSAATGRRSRRGHEVDLRRICDAREISETPRGLTGLVRLLTSAATVSRVDWFMVGSFLFCAGVEMNCRALADGYLDEFVEPIPSAEPVTKKLVLTIESSGVGPPKPFHAGHQIGLRACLKNRVRM